MKKAIITFFVTFLIAQCYAQVSMNFSTYEFYYNKNIVKAAPLEKRTLVVKEYEYTKKQIKKMQKKGTYDKSMKNLKVQNDALLKLVKDNWNFNTKIVSSSTFSSEEAYKESDKYLWLEAVSYTHLTLPTTPYV